MADSTSTRQAGVRRLVRSAESAARWVGAVALLAASGLLIWIIVSASSAAADFTEITTAIASFVSAAAAWISAWSARRSVRSVPSWAVPPSEVLWRMARPERVSGNLGKERAIWHPDYKSLDKEFADALEDLVSDQPGRTSLGIRALSELSPGPDSERTSTALRVLAAFIRLRSDIVARQATADGRLPERPPADIREALRVLARRNSTAEYPVDLHGAYLENADLQEAWLPDVDLRSANLMGADLRGANLQGANLRDANLEGATLSTDPISHQHLPPFHQRQRRNINLKRAMLSKANLKSARLEFAELANADLSGADLEGASLDHADLHNAILDGANLHQARFKGADLFRASFRGCTMRSAVITDADLFGALLNGADLTGTSLRDWTAPTADGTAPGPE